MRPGSTWGHLPNSARPRATLTGAPCFLEPPTCGYDWASRVMSMRPRQAGRNPRCSSQTPLASVNGRPSLSVWWLLLYFTNPSNQQLCPSFSPSLFPRLLSVETSRETEPPSQSLPPSHRIPTLVTAATMGDKAKSASPRAASPANSPPPAEKASSPPAATSPVPSEESAPLDVDEVKPTVLLAQGSNGSLSLDETLTGASPIYLTEPR